MILLHGTSDELKDFLKYFNTDVLNTLKVDVAKTSTSDTQSVKIPDEPGFKFEKESPLKMEDHFNRNKKWSQQDKIILRDFVKANIKDNGRLPNHKLMTVARILGRSTKAISMFKEHNKLFFPKWRIISYSD